MSQSLLHKLCCNELRRKESSLLHRIVLDVKICHFVCGSVGKRFYIDVEDLYNRHAYKILLIFILFYLYVYTLTFIYLGTIKLVKIKIF